MAIPASSLKRAKRDAVREVVQVLARRHPGLSDTALDIAGKMMVTLSEATAQLGSEEQRRLAENEERLLQALQDAVSSLATGERASAPKQVRAKKDVEFSRGRGLGKSLDIEEGRRRLRDFSTPTKLEDWAGDVAGPGELEKAFGLKRSTLHDWQKRGAVIGLLKGERKHVFPVAQFVDGRPVEGMSQVTRIIQNPRAAWQWLIEPKPSIGGAPLDQLKKGRVEDVVEAAKRDFG